MSKPFFYPYYVALAHEPEFELGIVVLTKGVWNLIEQDIIFINEIDTCFDQFIHKDFGFLTEDDEGKPYEVIDGAEVLGGYVTTKGTIYIATSCDRMGTIIMLPHER